jgi:hypothetical protein
MKNWLMLAAFAVVGSMVGLAAKTVIANHTAAAQPPTSASLTGA